MQHTHQDVIITSQSKMHLKVIIIKNKKLKKKKLNLNSINYEHGHTVLAVFGNQEYVYSQQLVYQTQQHFYNKMCATKNSLAESAWNQQSFGQFLHSLIPAKKKMLSIHDKHKKTKKYFISLVL